MGFPESQPLVKLGMRDAVFVTDAVHRGIFTKKEGREDLQQEEKAVDGVRDDDIREDGVRVMAAVAHDARDAYVGDNDGTVMEIDQAAVVVVVDVALTGASADRTGLAFRLKTLHVSVKNGV